MHARELFVMSELWRQLIDLSAQIDEMRECGHQRQRRSVAPRRGPPPTQVPARLPTGTVVRRQGHLQHLLEMIPMPHQEPEAQVQRLVPSSPPRPHERAVSIYVPEVTRVERTPLALDRRRRVVEVPDKQSWRGIAVAFFAGAVVSVVGFVLISQSGKDEEMSAPIPGKVAAETVQRSSRPSDVAGRKWAFAQFYGADPVAARAEFQVAAQSPEKVLPEKAPGEFILREIPQPRPIDQSAAQMTDDLLLERASSLLNQGSVADARAVYATMAKHGNSKGAFRLAESYDPDFCAQHHAIRRLKADLVLARSWYRKAAKLGSLEAAERLKELPKTTSSASEVLRR
jgi:hypothetical protein